MYIWDLTVNCILSSYLIHYKLRRLLLNLCGCKIGKKSAVHAGCYISGNKLKMGNESYINRNCLIDTKNADVIIGNRVGVAYSVQLLTTNHDIYNHKKRTGIVTGTNITIGDGCWLGDGVIVCPGVSIGKGCVIAAGSVVVKDCKNDSLYAGVPAKFIKYLNES